MNREIKFRGISIDEWVYGMLCKVNEGDTEHGEPIKYKIQTDEKEYGEYVKCFITDENTIGQYTGFHDRFGNEIYESDIVYVCSEDENAIIEWDEQTARFIIHFDGWIADFDNYYGKELEIMGDIYNNPELLGGENEC